jgi:hypothetical protein
VNDDKPAQYTAGGFAHVDDINPAGDFLTVFVRTIPIDGRWQKRLRQVFIIKRFDVLSRRVVDLQGNLSRFRG